jgi:hypothetical protein
MSASDPKSWGDQIVGFAVACLIAAVALYCAISVIESIWPVLVITIGAVAIVTAVVLVAIRTTRNRW